jgi:low temperature requirement protein LtrA
VLGECVLAASTAIQTALDAGGLSAPLLLVAVGGLFLVFGLWWAAFKHPADIGHHRSLHAMLAWGYGHFVVFAAIAALGAGLQVAIDTTHGATVLAPAVAALTVAAPVVVYLGAAWLLHVQSKWRPPVTALAVAGVLILAAAVAATWVGVPLAVIAMGLLLAGLVTVNVRAMQVAPA